MEETESHAVVIELEPERFLATGKGSISELRSFSLSLNGVTVHLCNIGASITKILVPSYANEGIHDTVDDVVLGFQSPKAMLESGNPLFFGAIVGRVANRIANGQFMLPGSSHRYELDKNNGPNHLHGGVHGFSHCIWDADIVQVASDDDGCTIASAVQFTLTSNDGDQGYPGTVRATATYSLLPSPSKSGVSLRLVMNAELLDGKPTPINLANHSYFNLASHNSSSGVLDHRLTMPSDFYTPKDANSIPTRQVQSLDEDPAMEFRGGRLLKDALVEYGLEKAGLSEEEAAESVALSWISTDRAKSGSTAEVQVGPYGFDHNYVVNHDGPGMTVAGIVDHEPTRRRLTVLTDTPGVQLYTANWIDGKLLDKRYCKDASVYRQWQAICLETQHFPDSIGVDPDEFPDFAKGQCFILRPGGPNYEHNVEYRFESIPRGSSESTASAKTPVLSISEKGTDSDGNVYNSIDEMWRSQGVEQSDGATNSSWYSKAEDYYEENCDATINGVLGGFAAISDLDLEGSGKFIERVRRERPSLDLSSGAACECGAGIGRVSKGLLLPLGVPRCDLVESSSRLLSAAPSYIGDPGADRCRYYCAGLQDWEPPKDTYSIIWIQWVLCYLTDIDVIKFLRRCGQALRAEGIIVLKENTCEDDNFVLDNEDASVTRSLPYLLKLVDEAGLCVVVQDIQDDLPGELFPVPMLALDVKSKR